MLVEPRAALRCLVDAALAAVAPDEAVLRHIRLENNHLKVFDAGRCLGTWDRDSFRRIVVLGAGKGAAPMAAALEKLFGTAIDDGLVIVKYGHGLPLSRIRLREGGHPVPDEQGAEAARELLRLAGEAEAGDLVLAVFTGGASALTPALAEGISLGDLQWLTSRLLASGATIHEMNALRKHLSSLSGGNLARAVSPASLIALVVSDVVGDELDVIASGPTVPDSSSFADALRVLKERGLEADAPPAILHRLRQGAAGMLPETPKPGDAAFEKGCTVLVASIRQALEASAAQAAAMGFEPHVLTFTMQGEARDKARELVEEALRLQAGLSPGAKPLCLLAGGETTVTLRGKGKGGRNQEMALAALIALENAKGVHLVCAGTDGTDGPTDAAGGFASGGELAASRMALSVEAVGKAARAALEANDSYAFLDQAGCLLRTGPTRTNVMDLAIVIVEPTSV